MPLCLIERRDTIRRFLIPPTLIRVKDVTSLVSWSNGKVFVFTSLSISHSIDERNILNFKGYLGVILRSGDETLGEVLKFGRIILTIWFNIWEYVRLSFIAYVWGSTFLVLVFYLTIFTP